MIPRLIRRYPCSWLLTAVVLFLSLCTVPETELQEVPFMDKWTHIAMYFTLSSVVWIEYLRSHPVISHRRLAVAAVLSPIALGGLVELLQAYATTDRSGDWLDFVANTLGVLLAAAAGFGVYNRLFKK